MKRVAGKILWPKDIVLSAKPVSYTHLYAALLAQSQKVAAHLQTQFGVKPGDRVNTWPSTGFSAGFPIGRGGRLGIWDRNSP